MINASGMTLDDLFAYIESARVTQILDNHRIWFNRHICSLNRRSSSYPILLVSLGMTLADLHANIDSIVWFEMYVHGCSMHQAWLSTI